MVVDRDVWFGDWVSRCNWVFAKTMPQSPHWYTHRKNGDSAEFDRVVETIREFGFDIMFKGYRYRVYEFEDMIYWPMGFGGNATPVDQQFLINRTHYPSPTSGVRVPDVTP